MKPEMLRIGNLVYSPWTLFVTAGWILIGTISYNTLAYTLIPVGVTWQFNQFGALDTTIALVVGSIPAAMNIMMNPILSTWSDKTRTRIGRRKPFLWAATPFIALFTVALGLVPQWTGPLSEAAGWAPGLTGILLLSILSLGFQFFSLIVGSVFCYLPPDVIPTGLLGRFMALIQIVTLAGAALFNRFLLGHLEDGTQWVYALTAGIFLVSFVGMCCSVREESVPAAPDPSVRPPSRRLAEVVGEYVSECFGNRLYWMIFLGTAITQASTVCRNLFNILFATKELHLSMEDYGAAMAAGSLASIVVLIAAGYLMDKLNPLLIYISSGLLVIVVNVLGYYWVNDLNSFYVIGVAIIMIYAVQGLCVIPMFVQVFPREKIGQFCSANAIINCIGLLIFNYLGGLSVTWFGYRFMFVWDFVLTIVASIFLIYVYVVLRYRKRIPPPAY